jgi:hypothetical protein
LTPPTFPSLPGMFPPPSPIAIPVPKLTLDNFQLQVGEQVTIPLSGPVTSAHSVQIVAVILNKNDKENVHPEGQFGFVTNFNQAPRGDTKQISASWPC